MISGNTATETLTSGQKLYIQTLLPKSPTLSSFNGAVNLNPIAELEPTKYVYTMQDPTLPTDTRFLHVLQGDNSGTVKVPATYLQSTSGTAFDGAVFGSNAVYFPVSATAAFTTTTLTAPSGVHTLFVTGLKANTVYSISSAAAGTGTSLTITTGTLGTTTDNAGVLRLAF